MAGLCYLALPLFVLPVVGLSDYPVTPVRLKMCGCNDCKNPAKPNVIIDWSKVPAVFNYLAIDGCSGEIWLYSDKAYFSLTGQGGKFMPVFPVHANEKQTMIGWVTNLVDGTPNVVALSQPLYNIPELQISVAWDKVGRYFENSLTNRPCRSRS